MTRQADYQASPVRLKERFLADAMAKGLPSPNEFFYLNVLGRKNDRADPTTLRFMSTNWAN
jgi:hypothetical protein